MNTFEINKMTTTERLETMEAIWDSLVRDETEIDMPGWHGDILDERRLRIERGEATFFSLDELKSGNGR
ncbi:addiction module protein [Methylotuvimicrobium sp.]|uniref:addiction module protein n=1 Tax=Methylotuvimicrobium sp. TaxID=2822413 RepID=UPI003D646E4E